MLDSILLVMTGGLTAVLIYIIVESLKDYFTDKRAAKLQEATANYQRSNRKNMALRMQLNAAKINLAEYEQYHFDTLEEIRSEYDKAIATYNREIVDLRERNQYLHEANLEATKELNLLRSSMDTILKPKKVTKIVDRMEAMKFAQVNTGKLFTTNSNQE